MKFKNNYEQCFSASQLVYSNELIVRAYALEMFMMDENNAIGREWQHKVANVLVSMYAGKFENWYHVDPITLREAITYFEDFIAFNTEPL